MLFPPQFIAKDRKGEAIGQSMIADDGNIDTAPVLLYKE
jgi:hypothetical protein